MKWEENYIFWLSGVRQYNIKKLGGLGLWLPSSTSTQEQRPEKATKAELLQLNLTQFPSLELFVSNKVGNQKNFYHTFIIPVLKVVY